MTEAESAEFEKNWRALMGDRPMPVGMERSA
jgi:hypothetical protein